MAGEPGSTRSLTPPRDAEHDLAPGPIGPPPGLLSNDLDTANHELWGIYPQTYSRAGSIDSALHPGLGREEPA
jgi:hypothetical protein